MDQTQFSYGERRHQPFRRSVCTALRIALAGAAVALGHTATLSAQALCADWSAEFVSVEGDVEILPLGQTTWIAAGLGSHACRGDSIRVGAVARAALRLPDNTLFRIDQNTLLRLPEPRGDRGSWVEVVRGIIHIISRNPRELTFTTPYMNAGLEGTELVLDVDAVSTDVTVIEGIVSVDNGTERFELLPGERGGATASGVTGAAEVANPFDATAWTPYSARILLTEPDTDPLASVARSGESAIQRAALEVRRGAFSMASVELDTAARLIPGDPAVPALRAMIALSRADKSHAEDSARIAIEADPNFAPGWIALSYVAQAQFDYARAHMAAAMAVSLAPDSAVTVARLAELNLATGNYRLAVLDAELAVALEPTDGSAHTIRGFALLAEAGAIAAIPSFQRAVELEPSSPLPRIGWALSLLRQGDTVAGRDQLEMAVVLDPGNAALRSLMAKVYAEEGRIELADAQLDLARALDPKDPTAQLYRAVTALRAGRPVSAVRAFDDAAALNDDAPVFRSQLRLDGDAAIRDFGFGALFNDVGFNAWGLRRGWHATTNDHLDHSGHQLLSDSYAHLSRHESARVNELYQARLLQPLSQNPIAPQLGEANLYLLDDLGPRELTASPFVGLVPENGLHIQGSAVGAGLNTEGYDVAISGLRDKIAYGIGHFDFSTDGFRTNNDLSHSVTSAHLQYQPDPSTNFIAELRHSDSESGDLGLYFDASVFNPILRQSETNETLRLGMRRSLGSGTLLVSANLMESDMDLVAGSFFASFGQSTAASVELQHTWNTQRWQLTTGAYRSEQQDSLRFPQLNPAGPLPGLPPATAEVLTRVNSDEVSIYAYGTVDISERVAAEVGLSADRIAADGQGEIDTNPKLGIRIAVTDKSTLRAALTSTTQGRIFSRRSIQPKLEPTHVMGFNQLFTGTQGEQAWRLGAAVEHRFGNRLLGGIEISGRDVDYSTVYVDPSDLSQTGNENQREELTQHLFLQWMPTERFTASAAYQRDRFEVRGLSLVENFATLDTRRLPLELHYFPDRRLHASARLSFVRQSGDFSAPGFGPTPDLVADSENFHVLDLSIDYRLASGRGKIALSIDNLLDEHFRFQDIDPVNPNIITERVLALRFTVAQ